jgi:hypothetical protein
MVSNDLFDKPFQDVTLNRDSVYSSRLSAGGVD